MSPTMAAEPNPKLRTKLGIRHGIHVFVVVRRHCLLLFQILSAQAMLRVLSSVSISISAAVSISSDETTEQGVWRHREYFVTWYSK